MATMEEIKAMIGKKKEEVLEIDRTMVRNFCQAIGDTNPRWDNFAPPGIITNAMISSGIGQLGIPFPFKRIVAAGADWEFYKPIKIGDTITTTHEFVDLVDKSSDKGPRALLVAKSSHRNQHGDLVAVTIGNVMSY